jgi:hypothetical protein
MFPTPLPLLPTSRSAVREPGALRDDYDGLVNRRNVSSVGPLVMLLSVTALLVTPHPSVGANTAAGIAGPVSTSERLLERAKGKVIGSLAITCRGRVRARMANRTDSRVVVTLRVGKRAHRVVVRSGVRRKYVTKGRTQARVVLRTRREVLDRARVPQRCSPTATSSGPPQVGDFPTPQSVGPTTEPTATYSGGCLITADDVVIENVVVNCQSTGLVIARSVQGVVIRNAVVNGGVFTAFTPLDSEVENNSHPRMFTVVSSRLLAGSGPTNDRAVGFAHFKVRDSYLQGAHSGLWAHNNAVIEDSYITTDGTDGHQSGLRMLKNSTLRGNTIYCQPVVGSTGNDTSGCSANAVFYREYGVPVNLTIERNYFPYDAVRGGGYYATRFIDCHLRDDCVNLRMAGNLFDRGQGTDGGEFPNDAGDVWEDNWWTDGRPALSGQSR